jgi:hypothetical protein
VSTTAPLDTAPAHRPIGRLRTGLVLAIVLGLANLPFLAMPAPDGEDGPPLGILVLGAVLGVVSIVTAVIAWRTGSRAAIRVTAACVIVNAVSALPAFFVDVEPAVKVAVSAFTLVSIVTVVLLLSRRPDGR